MTVWTLRRNLHIAMQKGMHWSRAFTGRITADVKLVGATISCEATLREGNPKKGSRQNAHVQSYAMATDQARESNSVTLCCEQLITEQHVSKREGWHHSKAVWKATCTQTAQRGAMK